MDYRKTKAAPTTEPRDLEELAGKSGNLYESIAVIARRADQIGTDIKNELNQKLQEFAYVNDNLEEVFENREQIEISKFYERLPKAALISIQELLEDNIYFKRPENDNSKF